MLPAHNRRALLLSLLCMGVVVAGCGARAALQLPGDNEAASSAAVSGGGGTTNVGAGGSGAGGTSGGGGAALLKCASLEWVGEPVLFNVVHNGNPERPRFVRTATDKLAFIYDDGVGVPGGYSVNSMAVNNAFTNWPPDFGFSGTTTGGSTVEVCDAATLGRWGFVAATSASNMWLGEALPMGNGFSGFYVNVPSSFLHFAARSSQGNYLVGLGTEMIIDVRLLAEYASDTAVLPLGVFGCAESVRASAVPARNGGGFWMASAADLPNDDCIDPDIPGPAVYAQAHHIDAGGQPSFSGAAQSMAPVVEVDIADIGQQRAWLGWRAATSIFYNLQLATPGGFVAVSTTIEAEYVPAQHAMAALGEQLALVQLVAADDQPGGDVDIHIVDPDGASIQLNGFNKAMFPIGTPAIMVDEQRRSVLIAYFSIVDPPTRVVFRRADCVGE